MTGVPFRVKKRTQSKRVIRKLKMPRTETKERPRRTDNDTSRC